MNYANLFRSVGEAQNFSWSEREYLKRREALVRKFVDQLKHNVLIK